MPDRKRWLRVLCVHVFLVIPLLFGVYYVTLAPRSWKGVDEAVVEKIAREHGREAASPVIDPGHGDLLLFFFLVAGAAGGFAAGFYWRALSDGRRSRNGSDGP